MFPRRIAHRTSTLKPSLPLVAYPIFPFIFRHACPPTLLSNIRHSSTPTHTLRPPSRRPSLLMLAYERRKPRSQRRIRRCARTLQHRPPTLLPPPDPLLRPILPNLLARILIHVRLSAHLALTRLTDRVQRLTALALWRKRRVRRPDRGSPTRRPGMEGGACRRSQRLQLPEERALALLPRRRLGGGVVILVRLPCRRLAQWRGPLLMVRSITCKLHAPSIGRGGSTGQWRRTSSRRLALRGVIRGHGHELERGRRYSCGSRGRIKGEVPWLGRCCHLEGGVVPLSQVCSKRDRG